MTSGLQRDGIASIDPLPAFDFTWAEHAPLSRMGRTASKLLLASFLALYLVGWAQDLQRLSQLEAEPSPPSKVISKYEAWNRIHASGKSAMKP
jgi:hypothetical protein